MKIAIFTDTYLPDKNGVSLSIDNFTKLMADDGHQIMIFCPKVRHFKDKKYTGINVRRYISVAAPTYKEMQLALPFIWTVVKDLKDFNPDVVHIQTPMGMGWVGIWAAKILKIKNIQTYHTYIPDFLVYLNPKKLIGINKIANYINNSRLVKFMKLRPDVFEESPGLTKSEKNNRKFFHIYKKNKGKLNERFGRDYTRIVYNRADLVLTPSGAMKNFLKKQGIKTKVEVMSNGVNYNFFKKKIDYTVKNRIVHTGRLGFEKNVDVVIKAFNLAQKINPDLRLDIYGDGPAKRSLQSLVKNVGIGKKVKFFGAFDIAKVSQQLCDYDFFVTASTIETQGIVILEAMSSGLPVLGVDELAVPEIIRHGKNGYLSKPFDVEGMAENMLKMLESDKRLEQFGYKSLEIAKSHEISKCKDHLVQVYERIKRIN